MQIRISDQRFSERNIPTSGVQGIRIFIFKEGYGWALAKASGWKGGDPKGSDKGSDCERGNKS